MRRLAFLAVLIAVGCAHSNLPPQTAAASVVSTPPPLPPPTARKEMLRRKLIIGGLVAGIAGVILSTVGATFLGIGEQSERRCREDNEVGLCGLSSAVGRVVGIPLLGVGIPSLLSGAVLIDYGASRLK